MAKVVKNNSGIRGVKFFIFLIVTSWTFLGWPGIKQAQAAHAFDTKYQGVKVNSAPYTFTYICGAGTTVFVLSIVVVGTTARAGGAPTYNGIAMTQADQNRVGGETIAELWYLLSPPTGASYQVSIPNTGTARDLSPVASSYKAQSGYISALNTANGGTGVSTNPTGPSLTGLNTGDVIVAVVGTGANSWAPTARTGTQLYDRDDGTYGNGAQYYITPNTNNVAMGWTFATSDDWAICEAAFKEVIIALSISVSPLTWGVGTVDEGTVQVSTSGNKIGITNDGNVAETFTLQIYDEDDRNEWTHSSLETGAGNNIYVLSGIFCATADSPTQTSFNEGDSEDVLTTTQQTATSTKFAYAGGSANAVAVSVSGQRSLWLRLDMPTAVSGTYAYEQHTVTVRISCQQS